MTIVASLSGGALAIGFRCRLKSMLVAVLNNAPAGSPVADLACDITRGPQDEHAVARPSTSVIGRFRIGTIGALSDEITTTAFHFTDINVILNAGDTINTDVALGGTGIDVTLSVEPF